MIVLLAASVLMLSCRSSTSYYVQNTTDHPAVVEVLTVDYFKPDTLSNLYLTLRNVPMSRTAYRSFETTVRPVRGADGTYVLTMPPHSILWLTRRSRGDLNEIKGVSIPLDSIILLCDTFPPDPCWRSGWSEWYDIVGHRRCSW